MTAEPSGGRSVSVVVPCRNRAEHVDRLLESLSWSSLPRDRFEVIVCDDGGSDHTRSVAETWRRRGLPTRYHRVRPPGRPRNNAVARNVGLRLARHPIVLNTDSDCVFVTDVLAEVVKEMVDGAFCSCGSYRTLTHAASAELDAIRRERGLNPDDYARRANGRPDHVDSPDGVRALHGAFGCWRDALIEIDGYDERYSEWGWEDRDLLTRLEAGLGLKRRFVERVSVVHVWHCPEKGGDRRVDFARRGEVSARALQTHMQRLWAQDLSAVRWRDAGPWSLHDGDADDVFTPAAYRASMVAERLGWPGIARKVFLAQVAEAEVVRRLGFPSLARRFLHFTATRAWERAPRPPRWQDAVPPASDNAVARMPSEYPVADLLESLSECELDLGDAVGAARTLTALASCRDGAVRAAVIRTRRLIMAGDPASLSLARNTLYPVSAAPFAAVRALAIELALLSGADDRAFDVTRATLSRLTRELDEFDTILFHAYLELLANRSGTHRGVPPDLAAEHVRWTSNVSEHLFSVAIRAMRSGLYHAAVLLLDRFQIGGAPADERLFVESRAHHAHLCERLERRGSQAA